MSELVLKLVNNENTLGPVSELDEGLQDATSIVLVAKLSVLLANGVDALLHDRMFLLSSHLLLLHEQAIVRDAQLLNQV